MAEHGNPNAKSDVSVAISLAMTTLSGGAVNAETDLGGLGDEAYAATVRQRLASLMRDSAMQLKPASEALGWKGHQPPQQ